MWLVKDKVTDRAINGYASSLRGLTPNYIIIDELFDSIMMEQVLSVINQDENWLSQRHSYSSLYVDADLWRGTPLSQRFVSRDVLQRPQGQTNRADDFLKFLRSSEFMDVLSNIFDVPLTDKNVEQPKVNTNFFRLGVNDFVKQHADGSPGRKVCMLLYLTQGWQISDGGELCFLGNDSEQAIEIAPLHNRCILFDPASEGSEHWVRELSKMASNHYRYNVTSWYWSE